MIGTTQFIVSHEATQEVINWAVKKRSRRLHKKLTKLRGPQFTHKPCAYQMGNHVVVHPEIYAALKREARP